MKCDMCGGTGYMETYVDENGFPLTMSTSPISEEEWQEIQKMKTAKVPCATCWGAGVLPEYLDYLYPGYYARKK